MKKSQLKTLIREVIEESQMKKLLDKLNPEYENMVKTIEDLGGGHFQEMQLSNLILKAYHLGGNDEKSLQHRVSTEKPFIPSYIGKR